MKSDCLPTRMNAPAALTFEDDHRAAVTALEWSITTAIPGADGVSRGLTCVSRVIGGETAS
jgi:hypothetical protein